MADLRLAALAALAGTLWVVALWRLGVTTHPAVLSWQRLARLRGLAGRRSLGERLGERLPPLRRLRRETDVDRLLTIAGRADTAGGWMLHTAGTAGVALAGMLGLDELALLSGSGSGFPPALALALAAGVALLAYARLRRQASERREALNRAVADSLPQLAAMTVHHRLPAGEALLLLARCQHDPALRETLDRAPGGARPTAASELPAPLATWSTAHTCDVIGRVYEVPSFIALGAAIRRVTERGLSAQDVYTGLARATYAQRLAEARVAAAQAKTLIVIPMGLMIVPVLVLIGAPLVASLAGIFAR
ncbi:MAG TPA: hypothetical protein VFD01_02845 [Candidatus Dormibacteraeota bacterium]|nr:hypothetical protein [Candidatus Dormibacteraeota bacterium]